MSKKQNQKIEVVSTSTSKSCPHSCGCGVFIDGKPLGINPVQGGNGNIDWSRIKYKPCKTPNSGQLSIPATRGFILSAPLLMERYAGQYVTQPSDEEPSE